MSSDGVGFDSTIETSVIKNRFFIRFLVKDWLDLDSITLGEGYDPPVRKETPSSDSRTCSSLFDLRDCVLSGQKLL